MLRNELHRLDCLTANHSVLAGSGLPDPDTVTICRQVQDAWLDAVLSGMPKDGLVPYFCYQLKGITEIADTLQCFLKNQHEAREWLLSLIDHLRTYYAEYLQLDSHAPAVYRDRLIGQLAGDISLITAALNGGRLSPALTICIKTWLKEISANQVNLRYTFRSLDYVAAAVTELAGLSWRSPDIEGSLVAFLIRINYNNLAFFNYLQRRLIENASQSETGGLSLKCLWKQRAELMATPEQQIAYAPSWPSVKRMIGDWLNEQIRVTLLLEKANGGIKNNNDEKLTLNLSVAYLACLIKLLYEEDVFGTQSLSSIFQFFCDHFKTTRQPLVSAKSLSKEFYSIDLHSATRIRDLLQKMIARINRNFFPVLAVISIATCFFRGIR